ncbi:MAG: GGDEF domain-containing protein [Alphaproteobacteria bacterium]|nr:GGDEF domain-containing protein [Alphaproteobacteria bacterium]
METSVKPPSRPDAPGGIPGENTLKSSAKTAAQDAALGALDLMIRHEIPPTPENYAVWFAYATGEAGTLRRTLDVLLTSGHGVDELQIAELFERYILPGFRDRAVDDVAVDLGNVTDGLSRSLDRAGAGANSLGHALSTATTALASTEDWEEIRTLVDTLRLETEAARYSNEALRAELANTTGEIAALRRKLEETRTEAMTDGLTGIANRKRFDTLLREAASHAMETGTPLTLLLLDIDHFKQFNDTHGHVVGDQVLRLVGRLLTECLRDTDAPARFGGEEFAVILPETGLEDARGIAERIRKRLNQKRVTRRSSGEDIGVVTISIGVACYDYGESMTKLIARADEALYRAKQNGRNRVMLQGE